MEDAAGFFAKVFGGERFVDYVRPSSLAQFHIDIKPYLDWRNLHHERYDLRRHIYDDRRRKDGNRETNE